MSLLKHRERQIVSLITPRQIERVIRIRLVKLVSAVIENHLQFAPDIEIERGRSSCSV